MVETEAVAAGVRGEKPEVVLANIKEHISAWAESIQSLDQVDIKKMSGLSNACYKVALKADVQLSSPDAPKAVLYRKFECEIIDKQIEAAIFKNMSDSGQGPSLIF